ncbi:MAG TPA: capsule biosynthesis GfcC family protein [Oleiagrimonas sp.]|nr:capsule biosynthesis GfcC family protein [Oleiagrimonas sp.]
MNVTVSGRVAHPGVQHLSTGARLSDAILNADVLSDAYRLGAAWLRVSLHDTQTRWKAALMYDVGLLRAQARLNDKPTLLKLATRLQRHWHALPVTGRQRETLLDPRPLEISTQDHLLGNGDRIIYPPRPTTVRVVGAVQQPCTLPFVSMQAARDYRQHCPLATAASADWLYIIQPDGHVTRHGIALWNREPGQPLAPGAMIYVPVDSSALPDAVRAAFNHDAVRFLSTQILPTFDGAER